MYKDFQCSSIALAINESTDVTSEAQLLMYGKFACGWRIVEELLCCLTLHSTTTGHDVFRVGITQNGGLAGQAEAGWRVVLPNEKHDFFPGW